MNLSLTFILGTRPELIKLSPLLRACAKHSLPYTLIHTGQHYSPELNEQIFADLILPAPDYNLHIGSCPQGEQTGRMLCGLEPILQKENPSVVITLGDPNSAFAGTLAAAKLHIPTIHLEAGRRSGNRNMSEELNRLMIDQIADYLFTPNETTKANLLNAGIPENRIFVSGDPIVDAVAENKEIARQKSPILTELNLKPGNYFLATLHRPENVDCKERLTEILTAFKQLAQIYNYPFVFAVHPKTEHRIREFGLSTEGILTTKPLGYLDFLRLEMDCTALLTDSGSLQEEACILKTPCVTLRDETERPETIAIGANILVGADKEKILLGVEKMIKKKRDWKHPFGAEHTTDSILTTIIHLCEEKS